jgi:hypothetical protein
MTQTETEWRRLSLRLRRALARDGQFLTITRSNDPVMMICCAHSNTVLAGPVPANLPS